MLIGLRVSVPTETGAVKLPAASDNWAVNSVPAGNVPVVVNPTETVLPTHTEAGLTAFVVIVWANDEAIVRSVAMQAKIPLLINIFFMYPTNIFSLTCSTGKVRDIFQIHSYTINVEYFSFLLVKYILYPEFFYACAESLLQCFQHQD